MGIDGLEIKGDNVLVRIDDSYGKDNDSSVVVIEDDRKDEPRVGVVVALGDGFMVKPESDHVHAYHFNEGDRVLFQQKVDHRVNLDGNEVYVLENDEVLAVLDQE